MADWLSPILRNRLLISVLVSGLLLLQAYAVAFQIKWRSWPFIDYPMYQFPRYEGERLMIEWPLYAEFTDGSEMRVKHEEMGIANYWKYFHGVVSVLRQDAIDENEKRQRLSYIPRKLEAMTGKQVAELRLEADPWMLTRDGPVEASRGEVIARLTFPSSEPSR